MKLSKGIANLVAELEYTIGEQCYNPNSYNGWTGEEGCSFRYPVYTAIQNSDGEYEASKHYGMVTNLNPKNVGTLKYKFGSNHLYIGDGIVNILEILEERYHLDFNELEKKRGKKNDKN